MCDRNKNQRFARKKKRLVLKKQQSIPERNIFSVIIIDAKNTAKIIKYIENILTKKCKDALKDPFVWGQYFQNENFAFFYTSGDHISQSSMLCICKHELNTYF